MSPRRIALLHSLLVALTLAACSPPATTDGGTDGGVDITTTPDVQADVRVDAAVDAGPPFGECTANTQCPGSAAICITTAQGYPGGLCSRRCTSDAQCMGGACIPYGGERRCFPRCELGTDCRAGYNCFGFTDLPDTRVCLPLCTADSQCGATGCNEYTGFCGTPDDTRGPNGGGCLADDECRSNRCFEELDAMGQPTGNLGGLCYSLCTIPDDSEYTTNLPHASCPDSAVCVRATDAVAGDIGVCRPECTTESDCHPGFICVHPRRIGGSTNTTNGYCAAMNCHYMTQMCPPNATCMTTATDGGVPTNGICAAITDAGVTDAGTDAADVGPADTGADASADVTDVVDDLVDDVVDVATDDASDDATADDVVIDDAGDDAATD